MKCDIERLERASALVANTGLHARFERDIDRLKSHPASLSKCLILSAPPPNGLETVLNATAKMDSRLSEEMMCDMVHQADVLFWVMSALRMFHGDFSPALDAALRESVPTWVFVTGVDAVGDTEAFIRSATTDVKARLGGESEIFIFRKESAEQVIDKISEILDIRAQSLAARGLIRRYEAIRASMLKQLTEFRRSVEGEFAGLERRLDTASHGLQAARIQLKSAAARVQDARSKIISLVERLVQDMTARIEAANDSRKLETVCKSIERTLGDFLEQRFFPEAAEAAAQIAAVGTTAWQDFQSNASRFLDPVYRTPSNSDTPQQDGSTEDRTLKFKSLAENYRAAACNSIGHFNAMFSGDWWLSALRALGTPLTKKRRNPGPLVAIESIRQRTEKERALAHLRSAATKVTEELRQIHTEFESRLHTLLDEEADAAAASMMNDANRKLEEPATLRKRVLEACGLLESYERQQK